MSWRFREAVLNGGSTLFCSQRRLDITNDVILHSESMTVGGSFLNLCQVVSIYHDSCSQLILVAFVPLLA